MNWNDIKYLIIISREGTLSAAAKILGVNQTTVSRRLATLERELGSPLINRLEGRAKLTPVGEAIIKHAENAELEMIALQQSAKGLDSNYDGSIRVTAVESLLSHYIVPRVSSFYEQYPNIQLELIADRDNLHIPHREADIAIRLARPLHGDMIARKLTTLGLGLYAATNIFTTLDPQDLKSLVWITYDQGLEHIPEMQWVAENVPDAKVSMTCTSAIVLSAAISAGVGIGFLPCSFADNNLELKRIRPDILIEREAWLLIHKDLKNARRIRAFVDWLTQTMKQDQDLLHGHQMTT